MRLPLFVFIFFLCPCLSAQQLLTDTVFTLREIQIDAARIRDFKAGLQYYKIDSAELMESNTKSLTGLVSDNLPSYVKYYGPGTLATLSLRGTSALHNGIYWNGMNIAPESLGMADISLIPAGFFNRVELISGGSSALFGTGNISGSLHLNNEEKFQKKQSLILSSDYGSDKNTGIYGKFVKSANNYYASTRFLFHDFQNHFSYTVNAQKKTMQHAEALQYGIIQDFGAKLGKKQVVKASVWYQYANRNIPPTLTMSFSSANQSDKIFRTTLSTDRKTKLGDVSLRIGYMRDYMHYTDSLTKIDSKIYTSKQINELESKTYVFKNTLVNFGLSLVRQYADIDNYKENVELFNKAAFFSLKHLLSESGYYIALNLRKEFAEDYKIPLMPSIGIEGPLSKKFFIKANISQNFRVPGLNDRYWEPGGNPLLKPEESWNGQAGMLFSTHAEKYRMKIESVVFSSLVDNWIMWAPVQGSSLWQPLNIQKVWSRGVELNTSFSVITGSANIKFTQAYMFTKSTNEKAAFANDKSMGKQLIYTPLHSYTAQVKVLWGKYHVSFLQRLYSKSFTSRDNANTVPGYALTGISIGRRQQIHALLLQVQVEIHNLFDKQYQVIQYRPMPGRSANIKVNLIL